MMGCLWSAFGRVRGGPPRPTASTTGRVKGLCPHAAILVHAVLFVAMNGWPQEAQETQKGKASKGYFFINNGCKNKI